MKQPLQSKKPFKILVVDDEPDLKPLVLQRMRRQVRRGVYSFDFASNGLEAIEKLRADEAIDMVLSDINMPRMDGLTLLAQLPEVDPDLRAVIISAYGDMRNIRTAMNRGAFDFITKPIDFDDLRVTIKRTAQHLETWRAALAARDQLVTLNSELDIAGDMQQSLLPTSFPGGDGYNMHACMIPARQVGGDLYDVVTLADGRVCMTVADVSGKGIPAALTMMATRMALKAALLRYEDLATALVETNRQLYEDTPPEMFVTAVVVLFDPATSVCSYSTAGHYAPLLLSADGSVSELAAYSGIALGAESLDRLAGTSPAFRNQHVRLRAGDSLLLYTDGVTEAMDGERREFGLRRLQDVFTGSAPVGAPDASTRVIESVNRFVGGATQSDDITCACLHRRAAAG